MGNESLWQEIINMRDDLSHTMGLTKELKNDVTLVKEKLESLDSKVDIISTDYNARISRLELYEETRKWEFDKTLMLVALLFTALNIIVQVAISFVKG